MTKKNNITEILIYIYILFNTANNQYGKSLIGQFFNNIDRHINQGRMRSYDFDG